jgi:hypothetical protein
MLNSGLSFSLAPSPLLPNLCSKDLKSLQSALCVVWGCLPVIDISDRVFAVEGNHAMSAQLTAELKSPRHAMCWPTGRRPAKHLAALQASAISVIRNTEFAKAVARAAAVVIVGPIHLQSRILISSCNLQLLMLILTALICPTTRATFHTALARACELS